MILGGHFDLTKKREDLCKLQEKLNDPNIWEDTNKANFLSLEVAALKKTLDEFNSIVTTIDDNLELLSLLASEMDEDILSNIEENLQTLKTKIKNFEIKTLLDGEFDTSNCYLEIHPGAGGTESCDWANMLLRMYTMFFDKFGFNYKIIDKQNGDEAGIKSVMVYVTGEYAYGYLKSEIGVHRLVRISPFDSNARRHTSFAAVNITPEFSSVKEIEIKEDDIRIDVYRSSGCGGQGVNTTDSAVRISHIPTGIVVTVQNERSQLKNKEIAFNILKNKLYKIEVEKRNKEINALKGNANINFGSQIRNYVLEPYSLVKDLRSNYESNIPSKVLDGEIYPFIEAYLRMKR